MASSHRIYCYSGRCVLYSYFCPFLSLMHVLCIAYLTHVRSYSVFFWVYVCVWAVSMCTRGLGEALQCIILLHLLYSSSPGKRENGRQTEEDRGVSAGTADMTAVALVHTVATAPKTLTLMCFR